MDKMRIMDGVACDTIIIVYACIYARNDEKQRIFRMEDVFNKKLITELAVTFAVLLVLIGGIFVFAGKMRTYGDEIAALRKELSERSKSLNAVAALRSEYETKVRDNMHVLTDAVPQKDELINLTKEFQFLSAKSGLESSFTFMGESPATETSFGNISFKLSVGGDFEKLMNFVSELNSFHYLSSFDSLSIARSPQEDKSTLTTLGKVYFRNQNETDVNAE